MKMNFLKYDIEAILKKMSGLFNHPKDILKYRPVQIKNDPAVKVIYSQGAPLLLKAPYSDILQYRKQPKELNKRPKSLNNVYANHIRGNENIITEIWINSQIMEDFYFEIKNIPFRSLVAITESGFINVIRLDCYLRDKNNLILSKLQMSVNSPYLSIWEYEYDSEQKPVKADHYSIYLKSKDISVSGSVRFEYDKNDKIINIPHSSGKFYLKDGQLTKDII